MMSWRTRTRTNPLADHSPHNPVGKDNLPEVGEALKRLDVGHRRAVASLIARLVSVAFLIAILSIQLPAVRNALPIANALGIALIAWPFFTTTGRLYGWRISLGRQYAEAQCWADAEKALLPLTGVRSALFDAVGEGRYHLALAWRALGKTDDARRLLSEVSAQYARTEWGIRAAETLATLSPLPVSARN